MIDAVLLDHHASAESNQGRTAVPDGYAPTPRAPTPLTREVLRKEGAAPSKAGRHAADRFRRGRHVRAIRAGISGPCSSIHRRALPHTKPGGGSVLVMGSSSPVPSVTRIADWPSSRQRLLQAASIIAPHFRSLIWPFQVPGKAAPSARVNSKRREFTALLLVFNIQATGWRRPIKSLELGSWMLDRARGMAELRT